MVRHTYPTLELCSHIQFPAFTGELYTHAVQLPNMYVFIHCMEFLSHYYHCGTHDLATAVHKCSHYTSRSPPVPPIILTGSWHQGHDIRDCWQLFNLTIMWLSCIVIWLSCDQNVTMSLSMVHMRTWTPTCLNSTQNSANFPKSEVVYVYKDIESLS